MKIAIGSLILECNSFSPLRSNLNYFKTNGYLLFGEDILEYHRSVRNELSGFISFFDPSDVEWVPTCAAWAVPHGPVDRETYLLLKYEFTSRIASALPLDGVYLALHGSMLVEGIDDPEGDLIKAVRTIIGEIPMVVSLDFHANVTGGIVEYSDAVVGYNSFPHDNLYETGEKSARVFLRLLSLGKKSARIFVKIPLISPMERMTIQDNPPVREIIRSAEALEQQEGILAASIFGVQSWLDIPEMGSSVVVAAGEDGVESARSWAVETARAFWDLREYFQDFKLYSPEQALSEGMKLESRPILINDPADNVGAAATGDGTFLLRALLDLKIDQPTILTIRDAAAVDEAVRAGVGSTIEIDVGGRLNTRNDHPVRVRGRVRTIFDGKYTYTGPVYNGVETSMGKTAVLQIGKTIWLQVTELPVYTIDPEHFRCVGLFPERMKFVGIKSQGSFKASYDRISKTVFYIDTPGISRSNIREVPFTRIDRDQTYPFNRYLVFNPLAVIFR